MNARVTRRLAEINVILGAHAGGVELTAVENRVARLRFTGMCTGCPLRPVTTASTIRPALTQLAGIDEVEILGSRISGAAERRLAKAFGTDRRILPAWGTPSP